MSIETGTHENGEHYARLRLTGTGYVATVEGVGPTAADALEDLWGALHDLGAVASTAADHYEPEELGV